MCTLTLAWSVFPDIPIVVAANRDEAFDRPSDPPTVRDTNPSYVAPRDRQAGGTWIGLAETGLTVAITNRWLDGELVRTQSRGLLVDECLRAGTARDAVETVEAAITSHSYDGFTLVCADDRSAHVLSYDGTLDVVRLEPGVHVVGNVGGVLNGRDRFEVPSNRLERGSDRVRSARLISHALQVRTDETAESWLARASNVLADHSYDACLHGDGYGTRSFTSIQTGQHPCFKFVDGPPCEAPSKPIQLPESFRNESESQF